MINFKIPCIISKDKMLYVIRCDLSFLVRTILLNSLIRSVDIFVCLQIRQLGRSDDGSINVKARGQQRFRLIRYWADVDGVVSLRSNWVALFYVLLN